jgi:LPPG:FO 2-phospho-L-lactate transferase
VVGGQILKGPSGPFLTWAGVSIDAAGVAEYYGDLLDAIVADEELPAGGLPSLRADTLLSDAERRRRVAADVLTFAEGLAG